jgi:phage gp29-like protein
MLPGTVGRATGGMTSDSAHVATHFFAAARALAWHSGSLQERLADAYADHLLAVTTQDLPTDLQPLFRELEDRLNRVAGEADEDPFQAAARELSDDEARALIDRILVLYARLAGAPHTPH